MQCFDLINLLAEEIEIELWRWDGDRFQAETTRVFHRIDSGWEGT